MTTPVVKPFLPNISSYMKYVSRAFDKGYLTNRGPLLQELEVRLAEYLGVKNVICVANCTLGLQVLYKALNLKGKVITTPFSYVATRSSLEWEGITPVFADIEAHSWNIDPRNVLLSSWKDVSAVLGVHVYGNPCDLVELNRIAQKKNVPVIYDAAHAFGVKYQGKSILSFGTASVLSFHATKLFHTGEGGSIVTDDDELSEVIRELISFGTVDGANQDRLGINAKMSELHAAMGLSVLDELPSILSKRRVVFEEYHERLGSSFIMQKIEDATTYNYSYCPILFQTEAKLLECVSALESISVYPRRYFYPSLERFSSQSLVDCKIADKISKRILCLPIFPSLSIDSVHKISNVVSRYS